MRGLVLVGVAVVMVAAVACGGSREDAGTSVRWEITDLGDASQATGINDRGQIVGSQGGGLCSAPVRWERNQITALSDSGTCGVATAVNSRGQIVGRQEGSTDDSDSVGFLWRNGRLSEFEFGFENEASAINSSGDVVGTSIELWWSDVFDYSDVLDYQRAWLWRNGKRIALGTVANGTRSEAYGLNDRGQVVGSSMTSDGALHAFLWESGRLTDLGTLPGHAESGARAINELGQIVGSSTTHGGRSRAVVWQNGEITDLGTLGGRRSWAVAINEHGQIVGASETSGVASYPFQHAFLWEKGRLTDLGMLNGHVMSEALGVNEHGQIVGWSATDTGRKHAVLWTPRGR